MLQIALLILVGSVAYRGAASIATLQNQQGGALYLPLAFSSPAAKSLISFYVILGFPLAFVSGYFLNHSWWQAIGVLVGTWIGMVFANLFLRFNPAVQFILFGFVNIAWLVVNIAKWAAN